MINKDGWLHTGDIGRFDERGFLYVTDRMKELIKFKGFQVPPAELEALICSIPQVNDDDQCLFVVCLNSPPLLLR